MKTGRNDPCPCGSGKKYKKCCLRKDEDEALRLAKEKARHDAEVRALLTEDLAREHELDPEDVELLPKSAKGRRGRAGGGRTPEPTELERQELKDPSGLSALDRATIDAWWDELDGCYQGVEGEPAEIFERILDFGRKHPQLVPHLGLDDELLLELGSEFRRRPDHRAYLDYLFYLRREHPAVYARQPAENDYALIAQLLVLGRRGEVSKYLDRFKHQPRADLEIAERLADLLAWYGLGPALFEWAAAVAASAEATPIEDFEFLLRWWALSRYEPYVRERETSPEAARSLGAELARLKLPPDLLPDTAQLARRLGWIVAGAHAAVDLAAASANPESREELAWRFAGYLMETRYLSWLRACFLADVLLAYSAWCQEHNRRLAGLALDERSLSQYATLGCRSPLGIDGLLALPALQATVCFADFLAAAGAWKDAAAQEAHAQAEAVYRTVAEKLDPMDPALRLYRSFDALRSLRPWGSRATTHWLTD